MNNLYKRPRPKSLELQVDEPEEFKESQGGDTTAKTEKSGIGNTIMKKLTLAGDKIASIVKTIKKPRKDLDLFDLNSAHYDTTKKKISRRQDPRTIL